MIHFNPIEYPVLNSVDLNIISVDAGKRMLEIQPVDGVRLYYGKRLSFIINNTTFTGRYTCQVLEKPKYYLILDTPCIAAEAGVTLKVYQTFIVPEDNQGITFQDLQEKFEEQKVPAAVSSIHEIADIGSNQILNGFQALKVDDSLFAFRTNFEEYQLTNDLHKIADFKLEPDKLNVYRIFLYDTNINNGTIINLEIGVAGLAESYYIRNNSHITQSYSFEKQSKQFSGTFELINNISLQLSLKNIDGISFVSVALKTTYATNLVLSGYISAKHPQDLWHPDENSSIFDSRILKLNNSETPISIDQTLIFADKFGEQRTVTIGETVIKPIEVTKYNITSLPVGYYTINRDNCPYGIPGLEDSESELNSRDLSDKKEEFSKLSWTEATLVVMSNGKYMLYTSNSNYVFIGTKFDIKDVKWYLISIYGHTHTTDELITGDNNLFVTQEQINTWNDTTNKVNNLSWKTYLTDESNNELSEQIDASIRIKIVNSAIKFDSLGNPIIYVFDGSNIVPTSIGALTVENQQVLNPEKTGTLIKQSTIDKLSGLGIGYKIPNSEFQYIFISNTTDLYSGNNVFIDLVERSSTAFPGNLSINFGIYNGDALNNSIFYGVGLESKNNEESDKILIGRWNNPVEGAIFELGIGTSEERKTAIWYNPIESIFGISDVNYYTDRAPVGYVLINGQDPVVNDFIHQEEFDKVKETVENLVSDSIFIKLIPVDESESIVIQRIPVIGEYSEYNLFNVTLTLNGLNISENISETPEDTEWKLQDKYSIFIIQINNPDEDSIEPDTDDEHDSYVEPELEPEEITSEEFEDDGTLILNLQKASIIRLVDESTSKTYEINMINYINNLPVLQKDITLNITDSNII